MESKIKQTLEEVGRALSGGDAKTAAELNEYPVVVLHDKGGVIVSDPKENEKSIAKAIKTYNSRGVASTRPKLGRVDRLTKNLVAVDVEWPSFDSSGKQIETETSHYIMRLGEDGKFRTRVALTRTL